VTFKNSAFLLLGLILVSAGVQALDPAVRVEIDPDALPHEVSGFAGEIRGLWRDGRVYIGGQPDEAAFSRFSELGVKAVVNLRTTVEVNDRERVPFDEAAVVEALGMEYIHIPLGGDEHPYTPQAVTSFAEVLKRHDGPILLHCTVAWRASHLWSAYLVLEQGFSLDDAIRRGEAIAIGQPPVEGLLGRPLKLVFAD
jgi:uncharacterized protein (TIGR01244 family)